MTFEDGKYYLSWHDVTKKCKEIAKEIKEQFDVNELQLYGIARGGLIPATIISHILGIRLKMLDVYSYKNQSQGNIVNNSPIMIDSTKPTVLIDDIYDTGNTYLYLSKNYLFDKFYTIIDKREKEFNNDNWYVFPWEDLKCDTH